MTVQEVPDRMRALLEEAGELDELARQSVGALAEDDYVPALQALTLELAATRLTIEAAALAQLEPRFVGDQLVEVEDGWYRISFMGHRERHGFVETVRLAGRQLVEVREPVPLIGLDGEWSGGWRESVERYSAAAVYSIAESSEDDCRQEALEELAGPVAF